MRDTFIFYRSFYDAISSLDDSEQLKLYKAITQYSLNFTEPSLSGVSLAFWSLIRPNLEANNKRWENGSKPKQKQEISKTEAKQKQEISKTEANKDKDKDKDTNNKAPSKKPDGFVYDKLFEEVWVTLKTGDKWNGYRAWINRRDKYRHSDILNIAKLESNKQFGKRHLSTLLNSDIDTIMEDENSMKQDTDKVVRYV